MILIRSIWVTGFLCALVLPGPVLWASADGRPAAIPRSLDLEDIKVQWFGQGAEELPSWINAHFVVGPLDGITGTVTETDLEADGVDDDGDPVGFETSVFNTADGSLRDVTFGSNGLAFTTVFADKDSGRVTYALRRSATVPGGWTLSAVGTGSTGISYGRNRFPLSGDEKKQGVLKIHTAPDDLDDPLPSI
ncbi:MAG TPA: hypothetical protein VK786_06470 [bacterium]|jgi:hypothetical protein|nr:hypothetical protein [bacterium]